MKNVMKLSLLGSISLLSFAAPAFAQEADADEASKNDEIVVTGTLIKGIAPVGTNVVGVSEQAIQASGVASTTDLMARVPQLSSFNRLPAPGTATGAIPFSPPDIRGLGGLSGMSTLVLLNGNRMVPVGTQANWIDPSMIPPGLLERVEIIPDGGSSIYGSDAVGGVINFILKKPKNGVEATARYGFADDYHTVDASVLAGKEWNGGGIMIAYSYANHDAVFGRDRSYFRYNHTAAGGQDSRVTTCNPGNVLVGAVTYPMPGLVAGNPNLCANNDVTSFYPEETRHAVFANLHQDLSDAIKFDLLASWSRRDTVNYGATNANPTGVIATGTITNANPYFQSRGGETQQTVNFTFDDVLGSARQSPSRFESWQVIPTLTADLGKNWSLKVTGNYGRSFSRVTAFALDTTALQAALDGTTTSTALNPYNVRATNAAVLSRIADYADDQRAKQELYEASAVLNGSLFALPGGDVRLAVGGGIRGEHFDTYYTLGRYNTTDGLTQRKLRRTVKSVYGELFIPVVSADNASSLFQELSLSVSGRYDDYSDVGHTFNPKIGVTYKPVEMLTIRGNWGKSFRAPSLGDLATNNEYQVLPAWFFAREASSPFFPDFFRGGVVLAGIDPNVKPEKATTWSIGADLKPVDGVQLSLTYWNVDYKDKLDLNPGFFFGSAYYADPFNQPYYILSPTLAQIQAFGGNLPFTGGSIASLYANGSTPYVIVDARKTNLGRVKVSGLDFNLSVNHPTDFGALFGNVGGTYLLKRDVQSLPTSSVTDQLSNGLARLSFSATVGARVGKATLQATVNHSGSFPIVGEPGMTRVSSFTSTNLFASYDLGLLEGTTLTLNVDNLFNADPPRRNSGNGVQFSTLGRLISIGVRTKF